ncbi:ankyrin repeat domain-containing protein [Pseudomonas resinovorans]|uniref:Ankyrin repeat domain-containing protein n=1 Tax=Metapseudomonas resinovorans TaxID=53412 RepID=A0ABT4Y8M6_METRE|nr:ankyrin repeat domain-containing protein [Pseudomonas resinovorans]MDA8485224.1 ankyrin repeat domain-containing protein [Pseudomonas resinovorans]
MKAGLIQCLFLASGLLLAAQAKADDSAAQRLLQAAGAGDLGSVDSLLQQGVPVDVRDGQGNTPLLLATAANQVDVARRLIEAGADVNLQNRMQDSAYLLAGASGHQQILELTLAHGADLRSTNRFGGTALIPACERGHVDTVRTLIAAGVNLDHVNKLGWTCLLEAVLLGDGGPAHQRIVELLIAADADLNLADNEGVTPLQHAEQRGQQTIAATLRAAGAR